MSSSDSDNDDTNSPPRFYEPDEVLQPSIHIGREHLPIAIRHGMELWWDGSTPTKRLDEREGSSQFTRFVNARIEGKLAEVAFRDFLQEYFDLGSQVDWRIYGEYTQTDEGDLQHLTDDEGNTYSLGVDFDLKKTKPWNSWLAFRKKIFDKIDADAPIVLSKMRIENDIQVDDWKSTDVWDAVDKDEEFRNRLLEFADEEFPIEVELVGSVYKDEFTDKFKKGDRLYNPIDGHQIGPPLKRPNAGIHVSHLDATAARWNRVLAEIVGDNPQHIWRPLIIVDEV